MNKLSNSFLFLGSQKVWGHRTWPQENQNVENEQGSPCGDSFTRGFRKNRGEMTGRKGPEGETEDIRG